MIQEIADEFLTTRFLEVISAKDDKYPAVLVVSRVADRVLERVQIPGASSVAAAITDKQLRAGIPLDKLAGLITPQMLEDAIKKGGQGILETIMLPHLPSAA